MFPGLSAPGTRVIIRRYGINGFNRTEEKPILLVLKKPKTLTSTRRVYLPRTVAEMLIDWKKGQELAQEELGDEYHDYQLVMAGPFGFPMEHGRINELFNQLIREHNLPKVVFHSLRHYVECF